MKNTRRSLLPTCILFLGLGFALTSCSHTQSVADILKTCSNAEIKDAATKIGPDVASALECEADNTQDLPACTKTALAKIAKRVGDDVLICAVAGYPTLEPVVDTLVKIRPTQLQTLGKKRQQSWLTDRSKRS